MAPTTKLFYNVQNVSSYKDDQTVYKVGDRVYFKKDIFYYPYIDAYLLLQRKRDYPEELIIDQIFIINDSRPTRRTRFSVKKSYNMFSFLWIEKRNVCNLPSELFEM